MRYSVECRINIEILIAQHIKNLFITTKMCFQQGSCQREENELAIQNEDLQINKIMTMRMGGQVGLPIKFELSP